MRCSRTEAPSLHRRYPASSVLRASPPPCSARPDPRGLSVGACHATGRASRVASIPLVHTCRRHYPGGTGRCSRRSLPDRWQPSPYSGRVGFRITRFEACAAFTSLRPAWSLNRPGRSLSSECFSRCRYLHRPLRLLPAGATVAGRDSHPLRNGAFSRRTGIRRYPTQPPHRGGAAAARRAHQGAADTSAGRVRPRSHTHCGRTAPPLWTLRPGAAAGRARDRGRPDTDDTQAPARPRSYTTRTRGRGHVAREGPLCTGR